MVTEQHSLDFLDLHILTLLCEKPLWKKAVHTRLEASEFDGTNVANQTVARRINHLHEEGFLESTLINPPNQDRSIMVAFRTTAKGRKALTQFEICEDCGELVTEEDHVHAFTAADAYFETATE